MDGSGTAHETAMVSEDGADRAAVLCGLLRVGAFDRRLARRRRQGDLPRRRGLPDRHRCQRWSYAGLLDHQPGAAAFAALRAPKPPLGLINPIGRAVIARV